MWPSNESRHGGLTRGGAIIVVLVLALAACTAVGGAPDLPSFSSPGSSRAAGPDAAPPAQSSGPPAALGDPLTEYLDRGAVQALGKTDSSSIGVVLTLPAETGPPMVREVVPDGPADRAGVRAGDAITAVDGKPVTTMGLYEVLEAL